MSSINVVDCILEVKIWCMFGFIWTWTYIGIRIDMAISLKIVKDYFEYSGANLASTELCMVSVRNGGKRKKFGNFIIA